MYLKSKKNKRKNCRYLSVCKKQPPNKEKFCPHFHVVWKQSKVNSSHVQIQPKPIGDTNIGFQDIASYNFMFTITRLENKAKDISRISFSDGEQGKSKQTSWFSIHGTHKIFHTYHTRHYWHNNAITFR
jgi:hypothetical protein